MTYQTPVYGVVVGDMALVCSVAVGDNKGSRGSGGGQRGNEEASIELHVGMLQKCSLC